MSQPNHLLFNMLLAVCPCQIQKQLQLSAKLLQVTNVLCIDVKQFEDKANHDRLIGEAHTERFLSFDAICVLEFAHFAKFAVLVPTYH